MPATLELPSIENWRDWPHPVKERLLERLVTLNERKAPLGSAVSLADFIRQAWPVLEPERDLIWNWHLDGICLPESALIETESGPLPIGQIVRDRLKLNVLCRLPDDSVGWRPIVAWMKSAGRSLLKLRTRDGFELICTDNHPVFVCGRGFVSAANIKVGDQLLSAVPRGAAAGFAEPEAAILQSDMLRSFSATARTGLLRLRKILRETFCVPALSRLLRSFKAVGCNSSMWTVWGAGLSSTRQGSWADSILQSSVLCGVPPAVSIRSLFDGFSANTCSNQGARQFSMRTMWHWFSGRSPARRSSHRLEQDEQWSREPSNSVQDAPPPERLEHGEAGSKYETRQSTIVSIVKTLRIPDAVYNVEVDEANTYFADGILVHNCQHLEAVTRGEISNLLINVPPGCMKSYITSVLWPAWEWTMHPHYRYLCSSYEQSLSTRDNRRCRDLIMSPWYQRKWPNVKLAEDQNQKTRYNTTAGGWRIATTMGGRATGEHPHRKIIDDPHNPKQAESDAERQLALDFLDHTLSTRGVALGAATVVIMQRMHTKDLSGHILEKVANGADWVHLCLPMEFEPGRMKATVLGWNDPRKEQGELLWAQMFSKATVTRLKIDLGSYGTAGQLQQRPSPQEGGLAKRTWWRFWYRHGEPLDPPKYHLADGTLVESICMPLPSVRVEGNGHYKHSLEKVIQSWDMSFKDKKGCSFVVGQVLGKKGADVFLLDQDRRQIDFAMTLEAVRALTKKWPEAREKLVEDKANGPAVISSLRHEISGIIEVEPQGGKEARAQAVMPAIESGNVYLPHPAIYPWVNDYIEEWAAAPNGDYWDQIDSTSQALMRLRQRRAFFI